MSSGVIFTYTNQLRFSKLLRRYKRFLADVEWSERSTGSLEETVYVPNTGSMLNLVEPYNTVPQCLCSVAAGKSNRKYVHTLEMIQSPNQGSWVGVHSALANKMVENALMQGLIPECQDFVALKREVEVKSSEVPISKIDFELSWGDKTMLLEVKSVTLRLHGSSSAVFPDSVSTRGQKHLQCLTEHVKKQGPGAAGVLFLIQRDDVSEFSGCDLDPQYVRLLHEACAAGVAILPYRCSLNPNAGTVTLLDRLPFVDTYVENGQSTTTKAPTKKRKAAADIEEGQSTKRSGKT